MTIDRRRFLQTSAVAAGVGLTGDAFATAQASSGQASSASPFGHLKPMIDGISRITTDDRKARVEQARRLMGENKIDAIILDSGTSLGYFTGVRWWASERTFVAILPAKGEVAYVCPKFEEGRARELIAIGSDVRTWEEHESPFERIAQVLRDRGASTIGFEEYARFFVFDGLRQAAPTLRYVSATPITAGCRVIKSPKEIALMQRATDITIEAYRALIPLLRAGMAEDEVSALATAAHRALGADGGIGASFGEMTSSPHGSIKRRPLREGDVVLMDGGCKVDGYSSDISRTVVLGKPTKRQMEIWDLAKRSQAAAFAAAKLGATCEDVDAAARKVQADFGFGPDYKLPGLPHRTGHGIGLDGHEWTNLVRGNTTKLAPGMCFSNEPMVVVPGEFGVRIEDCFHMTEQGPKFFSTPSPAIDKAVA
ncbi:MAG TPA: Xaa-Pro peptidase family protein [Vicinamibacterales bacterium]|jgi:Xaa-Pro dipeptidase